MPGVPNPEHMGSSKQRTAIVVSHTHWDREWYLTFQQFRMRLVAMVDDLLDLLDREERYRHFMLDGQTILLDDYLEIRPERQADLARHVATGRLSVGPWYVQPDSFLPEKDWPMRIQLYPHGD